MGVGHKQPDSDVPYTLWPSVILLKNLTCAEYRYVIHTDLNLGKRIVKSGTISGWTDDDQLQNWGPNSSSTNNIFSVYVTQDKLM